MITLKLAKALPDHDRLDWDSSLLVWEPGRSLAGYLQRAGIAPAEIDRVVWRGRAFQRDPEDGEDAELRFAASLAIWEPGEHDEIHVIPRALGRNAALIAGVVGGLVAIFAFGPFGLGWATNTAWGAIQTATVGFSVGSMLGSLVAGKPKAEGPEGATSHAWGGIGNSDRAGVPVPVGMGRHKQGGVRVAQFIRRTSLTQPEVAKEKLYMMLLLSKGPISGISDVKVNEQPIANFPDLTYKYTKGETPEQWYDQNGDPTTRPDGFDVEATTYPQNHDLADDGGSNYVPGTPFSYTSIRTDLDAFEILLTLQGLGKPDNEGNWRTNTVRYSYRYRLAAGLWSGWIQRQTTGSWRVPKFATIRQAGLTPGQYEIEVRWDSADQTEVGEDLAQVTVTGITEEKQRLRTHPGKAMLALEGIATESLSHLPVVTCLGDWILAPQWDGNAFTAPEWTQNPAWLILEALRNRTFTADLGAEGLRQVKAWGIGDYVPDAKIDLDSFKEWADWCDELIPFETIEATVGAGSTATDVELTAPVTLEAGKTYGIRVTHLAEASDSPDRFEIRTVTNGPGATSTITVSEAFNVVPADGDDVGIGEMEPRCQLDIVLDQQRVALPALNELAATARATLMISGGKIKAVVDKPGTPVQMFGMGNTIREKNPNDPSDPGQSTFGIEYNLEGPVVNTYDVVFLDRDRDYDTTPIEVRDKISVAAGTPPKRQQLPLYGITRRSQAIRETRFRLNTNRYIRSIESREVAADAVLAEAGDLYLASHDVTQWGWSGRVHSQGENPANDLVMLDRSVTIEAGKEYEVRVRFADDSIEIRNVVTPPDPEDTYYGLEVDPPFSQPPSEGDLWQFGEKGISAKPFRIISISRSDYTRRRIIAVEYNRSVVDDSGVIEVIDYSQLPNFSAPPPPLTGFEVYEEVAQRLDLSVISTFLFQVEVERPSPDYGFFKGVKYERSEDGVTFEDLGSADGTEFRWPNVPQGVPFWFRATPYSTAGKYNFAGALTFGPITADGVTDVPADVVAETPISEKGRFVYRWREVTRAHQYEIRSADANWGNTDPASGFLARGRGQSYTLQQPASRSVTLYVKAVDAFGNYSANATGMTCTDSAPTAPVLTSATRTKRGIRVKVAAHAHVDVIGMHLHASTAPGFTPDETNRVAQVVSRDGGDFVFETENSATFYFRVTAEDHLTARLGDWVYSGETNEKILVVTPVNPVVAAPVPKPPRRRPVTRPESRQIASGSTSSQLKLESGVTLLSGAVYKIVYFRPETGTYEHRIIASAPDAVTLNLDAALATAPVVGQWINVVAVDVATAPARNVYTVRVEWTHTDHADNPPQSLVGFQVVLYDPADATTFLFDSGLLGNPLQRFHVFPAVELEGEALTTIRAAVRAIYVDGLASALVGSAGDILLDPIDRTEPPMPDPGKPRSTAYTEDFLGASLPTGFTTVGAAVTSVSNGILKLTKNVAQGNQSQLNWNLDTWTTARQMKQFGGPGSAEIRIRVTPRGNWGSNLLSVATAAGWGGAKGYLGAGLDDGLWHVLQAPHFTTPSFGAGFFVLDFSDLPNGTVVEIDSVTMFFEGNTSEVNAHVQLGVEARDQFDTPDGGSTLNLVVPVRLEGPNDQALVVEKNGVFFIADSGGTLRTLASYRQGSSGTVAGLSGGGSVFITDQSVFAPPLFPARGTNKVRLNLEKVGAANQQVAPLGYPVREVLEPLFVDNSIIALMHWIFEGGTVGTFTVTPSATQSQENRRSIALGFANRAWYYVSNDGGFAGATAYVYRLVVDLLFTMPLVQKPDGSYYWAEFALALDRGVGQLIASPASTAIQYGAPQNHKILLPTDGRAHQVALVRGTADVPVSDGTTKEWKNTAQDVNVELTAVTFETGAGSPSYSIHIEKLRWFFVTGPAGARIPSAGSFKLIYFEEH